MGSSSSISSGSSNDDGVIDGSGRDISNGISESFQDSGWEECRDG